MQNILPPPALQGDERAQLTQVYRYLFRLSEQLNVGLSTLEQQTAPVRPLGASTPGAGSDEEKFLAEADRQYQDLKSLIIKTADNVRAEMDQIVTRLNSKYVAKSEWGTYKESVSREIVDTAKYTIENFQYGEEVLDIPEMAAMFDEYRIETSGYIKRGIIGFDSSNFPIIGIAIGQGLKYKKVTSGGKVYEVFDNSQNMATYAADKLSFWIDGAEVAYMSNSELVVTRIIVSDSIQLGSWDIAVNSDDGLTVQKRIGNALDLSGNNTITVTADQINMVADQIDLSGNTSIVLTAGQINAVADQIDLKSNETITLMSGRIDALSNTADDAMEMAGGGVATTDVEFYLSTSATELSGGSWQTVAPEWVDGKYMWMQVRTALKDGTERTSKATCISGATGQRGVGVEAVTEEYCKSTSKTVEPTSGWQTTQPTWENGYYIWTRVRIDYSDGTWSYTQPYCDATWEVVNDVAIYTGADEPTSPAAGKVWLDTGSTPNLLKKWNGSSWDTVSDIAEIESITAQLAAQQAAQQQEINNLATALSIDTSGVHVYKPGYQNSNEVRIDQDSVDVLVGGSVASSFLANGLILGNYRLWHPQAAGGLAFNLEG